MDKAEASRQLDPEQLCKLQLSILSKNVVKGHRESLSHRVTYKQSHWRSQRMESRKQTYQTRHDIMEEMKENEGNGVVGEKS